MIGVYRSAVKLVAPNQLPIGPGVGGAEKDDKEHGSNRGRQ
jgi:hypothetical protein